MIFVFNLHPYMQSGYDFIWVVSSSVWITSKSILFNYATKFNSVAQIPETDRLTRYFWILLFKAEKEIEEIQKIRKNLWQNDADKIWSCIECLFVSQNPKFKCISTSFLYTIFLNQFGFFDPIWWFTLGCNV